MLLRTAKENRNFRVCKDVQALSKTQIPASQDGDSTAVY